MKKIDDFHNLKLLHLNGINDAKIILLKFLYQVNASFYPSLDSTVNIKSYLEKILSKAYVCVVKNEDKILGHYAIYLNDIETKIAYLTTIAVLNEYKGTGIAQVLLIDAIMQAKLNGMTKCRLEVNTKNNRAIRFYEKNGFQKEDNVDYFDKDRLYMIKNIL